MEYERVFWVYFIITLFFIIVGLGSLFSGDVPIWIIILWLLNTIFLMITVYCTYLSNDNNAWLNVLFISMLIISYMWTFEINNKEDNNLDSIAGISLLLGGLILSMMVEKYTLPFWTIVVYLLVWLVVILNSLIFSQ